MLHSRAVLNFDQLAPVHPRRLTRGEYDRMVALDFFRDEHVELVEGQVVAMSPIGPPHSFAVQRLTRVLLTAVARAADVRIQSPFAASDQSEPEPDAAVVPPGRYDQDHPARAHLVVEVADTSLAYDREKARLYATSGVPEYWIVNLRDTVVEVHTLPRAGMYTRVERALPGDVLHLVFDPQITVAVSDFLG
jgi:Uma2 family endonuclease